MAGTYDQFIAFGVDNAGLERTLRFVQACCMIITSYPTLLLPHILPLSPAITHLRAAASLSQLAGHLNITRRWMRTFRFLEALRAGWAAYTFTGPAGGKTIEVWLDAHAKTCLGLFGMMETVTLIDLVGVEHLEVFGRSRADVINFEAQRFWFAGLLLSALASGVRLVKVLAFSPVPRVGDFGAEDEKTEALSVEEKKIRLEKLKEDKKELAKKVGEQKSGLVLKMMADVLDLVIPASVLGWVKVEPGLVGVAMFLTTILTGLDVWRRCGREVAQKVR